MPPSKHNSAEDDRLRLAGVFLAVSGKPNWMNEAAAVCKWQSSDEEGVGGERCAKSAVCNIAAVMVALTECPRRLYRLCFPGGVVDDEG